MRDFLFSDIAAIRGFANVPDDPDLAIAAGSRLCEELLELIQDAFGCIAIRRLPKRGGQRLRLRKPEKQAIIAHQTRIYSTLEFFPRYWAFNIGWHERPQRTIYGSAAPRGFLTRPGMPNHEGSHEAEWAAIV